MSPIRRRFLLSLAAASALGALFLWLALRQIPGEEAIAALGALERGRLALWAAIYVAIYAVCHAARVVRWNELVRPIAGERAPSAALVARVCAVGFAAILLLPLRMGELVRPYLLARKSEVAVSALLGTAVVERVIDGLVMTGLLFATLATYGGAGERAEFAWAAGGLSAGVFLGALIVLGGALWRRAQTVAMIEATLGRASPRLGGAIARIVGEFIDGFRALARARALGRFFALTAIYWGANVLSMWCLARFGFGLEIGAWEMASVLSILVIGIMIPGGPAMAGNFEYFLTTALALYVGAGAAGAIGAGFAATVHLLQLVVIVAPAALIMAGDPAARRLLSLTGEASAPASAARS